jgi:hypothetical protein
MGPNRYSDAQMVQRAQMIPQLMEGEDCDGWTDGSLLEYGTVLLTVLLCIQKTNVC